MTGILDLNDIALKLWHDDNGVHSPGYVWYDGDDYRFGTIAQGTSRRTPRAVNTRFWSQLSTQKLAPTLGPARHTADLAHAHLKDIHSAAGLPERLLVAAPGSMTREQLSLLLGIMQPLPFSVVGLVHRSSILAAASGLSRGIHVELQLHQLVVTPFDTRDDDHVEVGESQILPGQGLLALQDQLATAIARLFVAQTRFDPLRNADTEQALYDNLPALLERLQTEAEVQLALQDYQVRVTRDDLADIGQRLTGSLQPLLASDRTALLEFPLSLLPGLHLGKNGLPIDNRVLPKLVGELLPQLVQAPDALVLLRRVPTVDSPPGQLADKPQNEPTPPHSMDSAPRPTHLLKGHVAKALDHNTTLDGGACLQFDGNTLTLTGQVAADLRVNGQPAQQDQPLAPGDTLRDSLGFEATLIIVED